MRVESADNYGFKDLQNIILNIANDIDSFCVKHGIQYCLMGGSALGAKRHGGFIPWDDDMDIFMTPDNYKKFRDAFNEYGDKSKYYLQELGASNGKITTAKIRLNNSYYYENNVRMNVHYGIYVDIFILHTCPNNMILRCWQYFWAKYIIVKGMANWGYERKGKVVCFLIKCISVLPKRFFLDFGLKQVYRFRAQKSNYYCNYLGKALMKNGTYKRAYFERTKRVSFETITLNAPIELEKFLSERFGDYMMIPSVQRIKHEQHAKQWGIGEIEYNDLSDEKYCF